MLLKLLGTSHERLVHRRRVRALAEAVARLLPEGRAIDIGCGDGTVAALIARQRPDIAIEGYEVVVRDETRVPVYQFDGRHLPLPDGAVDAAILVDVLHHNCDPITLLREAARVARTTVIVKDHRLSRPGARLTLKFMDWVGNRSHGVALPYTYWPEAHWQRVWEDLGLTVAHYETRLGLYPFPFHWLFESGLHFIAALAPRSR